VITYPTADCCVGPGRRAPAPPPTLKPAVGCRSRILKHFKMDTRKENHQRGIFLNTGQFLHSNHNRLLRAYIYDWRKKEFFVIAYVYS
jgi:hypothetical protein